MRFLNLAGRAAIAAPAADGFAYDLERSTEGLFSADPQSAYLRWDELRSWVAECDWDSVPDNSYVKVEPSLVGPPSPRPRQVFGVGLNYRRHAAEAGLPLPSRPVVFTKFPSCLTGAYANIELPTEGVDWEVELVVVIGREARDVSPDRAWDHVAGLSVGQDISEREVQGSPPVPQFSMGKSFPTFGPFGPHVVTVDEVPNPDDLELSCAVNGAQMQCERTSDLIFPVSELIAYLSSILPLYSGDVIFTGTPSGVGAAREPKIFLRDGDVLLSEIEGVGRMQQECKSVAPRHQSDDAALVV